MTLILLTQHQVAEFNVTPVNEPSVVDNVVDFFTSGGLIGNIASNIFDTPENQYAGITGEDGIWRR